MFKNFLNKNKYQLILFLIVLILFLVNYKSGTYLTGWDNLQTELNPGLAVKRAFFSVWEEYQSFGLTAGMAHAADLPRAVFLWIMSYVMPQNMIRYFYHFLMLLLGGIGVMGLLAGLGFSGILAFLGALFYLFNLGTMQIFYLPYEAFSTFFALLPWGVWSFIKLFKTDNNKRSYFILFLINLLGTPAFYTQQLFIVYNLILGCFTLGSFLQTKNIQTFKKALLGFALILLVNSFWLLPQFYFLKTNRQVVTEAKNNQLSTEDVFYQNYEKGTLNSFLKLEGFYFDLKGRDNTFLFAPWKNHFGSLIIKILPYLFGILGLLGIITGLKKKKDLGFVLVYLFCTSGLLLATPPFSWINELIRQIPIVNQIFRSPFTKFIIPYSLVYSYFVAVGIKIVSIKLRGFSLFFTACFLIIFLYSLPSFQGYFFSPEMKVKIPDDYHSVIDYFKNVDKNSRIALSPDYTFWGWFFNKWGYNGSGFLWYGIEQPIVSRTFDVWSKTSESYFWEIKTAFEAEDIQKINSVFDKYQIDYLLLDKSLVPVVSSYKALQYDRISKLLLQGTKITPVFDGENVSLYKIDHDYLSKNFIGFSTNLNNIGPKINITNDDPAFLKNGFYMTGDLQSDINYPFLSLTSQTNLKDKNWQIGEDDDFFYLSAPLTINIIDFDLYLNDIYQETILIDGLPINISLKLVPTIENNKLVIKIGKKITKNFDTNIDQKTDFSFTDPTLSQNTGYLIKAQSINSQGPPLFFYIIDETKKQSYLEVRLDNKINYFILPPRYKYGLGYTFAFQNNSFKNLKTFNNLEKLSLYLFPYPALKEMKFVRKGFNKSEVNFSNDHEVKKLNYFTYQVQFNSTKTGYLILSQSFDPGWIAFANGKKLNHVLINNWANGFEINNQFGNNQKITIVFWPQYLEFLGFGFMIIIFLLILVV